jgi:ribosomal protein S18 acetylase RimI-like enzyme
MINKKRKMDNIEIVEVEKTSRSILESLQKLIPQLTTNYRSFDQSNLDEIVRSEATHLFVAYDLKLDRDIVGAYTIVHFRTPTGNTIRIEDVIVDEKKRGQGIGKKMMYHALEYARKIGVTKIELTSHSSRIEANKLYQSLGFKKIETNVYRYEL